MVPIPEIVVSSFYDRVPKLYIHSSRRNILKRDRYVCQYSGRHLDPSEATVDHIIPKSKGGKYNWINCVTSSFSINNEKSDSCLEDTDLRLIRKPLSPKNKLLFSLPSDFSLPESWKEFLFKNYTKSGK
jgi:5-methylcytosine-specific restriction endonuclease McrA